jgi:signal transduction histidine kinase/CheY-like chemotaxis protein
MGTIRALGQHVSSAKDVKDVWRNLLQGLEQNDKDIPLAMLYSTHKFAGYSTSPPPEETVQRVTCELEGLLGLPDNHAAAPAHIDLEQSKIALATAFREAVRRDAPLLLQTEDDTLPTSLLADVEWRGFGASCTQALVVPIRAGPNEILMGFLLLALNPRRLFDQDFQDFINLVTRTITTKHVSAVLFAEEIKRGRSAAREAAVERAELTKQLKARTQEYEQAEAKFWQWTHQANVGLALVDPSGAVVFSNDFWTNMTSIAPEHPPMSWLEAVVAEDKPLLLDAWQQLSKGKAPVKYKARIRKPWRGYSTANGDMEAEVTTVLSAGYPDLDSEGNVKSIMSCIMDISEQQWIQDRLRSQMERALEMKRTQENFIDMTSHEIRNPLSAVLHCADEIIASLSGYRAKTNGGLPGDTNGLRAELRAAKMNFQDVIKDAVDAAQTIVYCVQHQKRIVDGLWLPRPHRHSLIMIVDVLTLSKINSDLLSISPVPIDIMSMVREALKMFGGELRTADIAFNIVEDPSLLHLSISWALLDPSRVLQVLINLMTNAIKFTRAEPTRFITVKLAASKVRPSEMDTDIQYFPQNDIPDDVESEVLEEDTIYLSFSVRDTGVGLGPEEKKVLFHRFSQGSPKTHVKYGGSGLGLFISRKLSEMQGGEIGVASERGKGSTFVFFVKTKRTPPPRRQSASEEKVDAKQLESLVGDHIQRATAKEPEMEASPDVPPQKSAAGLKVLVVEDNIVNQKVLTKQLKKRGLTVAAANHGGEALDALQKTTAWRGGSGPNNYSEERFDVVLMDLEMPTMDGLTCVRRIRELEASGVLRGHTQVIAVTANVRSEHVRSAMNCGVDDFTTKPYKLEEILGQIERLSRKRGG